MSDLISREAAIEAITNYAKFLWDNYHETCNLAGMIDAIDALPAAEPRWIPVTEAMPGYGEDVLLSINGVCSVGHCVATNRIDVDWYYDGWYYPEGDVDAWMPLPKPRRGEKDA